jgi:hypothetical protein
MKRMMITLVMIVTLTSGAFAGNEKIKQEVLDAFKNKFPYAQDVTWTEGDSYYQATFTFNGARLNAFYSTEAKLKYVARNIISTQLPLYLQNSLKMNYAHYWITDLFELSGKKGFSYYITLEDADEKVVLKSAAGSDWELYKKTEKQ